MKAEENFLRRWKQERWEKRGGITVVEEATEPCKEVISFKSWENQKSKWKIKSLHPSLLPLLSLSLSLFYFFLFSLSLWFFHKQRSLEEMCVWEGEWDREKEMFFQRTLFSLWEEKVSWESTKENEFPSFKLIIKWQIFLVLNELNPKERKKFNPPKTVVWLCGPPPSFFLFLSVFFSFSVFVNVSLLFFHKQYIPVTENCLAMRVIHMIVSQKKECKKCCMCWIKRMKEITSLREVWRKEKTK